MKLSFKRKKKPDYDLAEIHQYTQDLERVTMLRDKSHSEEERERYTTAIKIMQLVLVEIQGGDTDGSE